MAGSEDPKPRSRKRPADDDPAWEIEFFRGIVENSPNHVDALINLGNLYTKRGDYAKGLEVDRRLVQLRPDDAIVHYNLACSMSLMGEIEGAFAELKLAVDLGYNDLDYILSDGDLDNIRKDPRFSEFIDRIAEEKTMNDER